MNLRQISSITISSYRTLLIKTYQIEMKFIQRWGFCLVCFDTDVIHQSMKWSLFMFREYNKIFLLLWKGYSMLRLNIKFTPRGEFSISESVLDFQNLR
jgi:hypothetical protein